MSGEGARGVAEWHRGDQAQPVTDVEQEHRLGNAAVTHRRRPAEQAHDAVGQQRRAAAHEFDDRTGARGGGSDQFGGHMQTGLRVDDFVGGIDHQDEIMVAQSAEPGAQARLGHRRRID